LKYFFEICSPSSAKTDPDGISGNVSACNWEMAVLNFGRGTRRSTENFHGFS